MRATYRAPPSHRMHRLRSRRAKQSGSPTELLDGPEALINQRQSLTPPGGATALERLVQARPRRLPRPPPVDPLGVGVPHPHPLRCLFPKHNLLTEGGHGPPPSLAHQQCLEVCRRRDVPSDFHNEVAARPRSRRTVLQRVLRRIHARIAVVATRGRLFSDSV